MNIVFISAFDSLPEDPVRMGRYGAFARACSARGDRVTWIGQRFAHISKTMRSAKPATVPATFAGVSIVKLDAPPYARNISLARLRNHAVFGFQLRTALRDHLRSNPTDVVVCATPPLLAPILAAIECRCASVPFVLDVIDLWPDAFGRFVPPRLQQLVFPLLRIYAHISVRLASAAIAVSMDYLDTLKDVLGDKPREVVHLGFDLRTAQSLVEPDWTRVTKRPGETWITYVGTVSKNYDLGTVIRAAPRFPDSRFLIAGSGEALDELRALASSEKAENVIFLDRLSFSDIANLLHRSDVGLLTIANRALIRFPYKANDYFAMGLPVITDIMGGEIETLVTGRQIGVMYREGDVESFAASLAKLLGRLGEQLKRRVEEVGAAECDADEIATRMRRFVADVATHATLTPTPPV